MSEPEATETWAIDPRVPEEAQLSDAFYARLRRQLRTPSDFFARGHLTRREDPNWGRAAYAERANDDTFHHPNACPQVNNAFNASQKAWQGIENYILNSTDDSNLRVTVITGPVFRDNDPVYEDDDFGPIPLPRLMSGHLFQVTEFIRLLRRFRPARKLFCHTQKATSSFLSRIIKGSYDNSQLPARAYCKRSAGECRPGPAKLLKIK